MKKREFVKMVIDEIEAIKVRATDEEKSKLDFSKFNHRNIRDCIYGQMTGSCDSKRAKEIMGKKFEDIEPEVIISKLSSFESQSFNIGSWFTSLEKYLYMVGPEVHLDIIEYIKGLTQTLKLKVYGI